MRRPRPSLLPTSPGSTALLVLAIALAYLGTRLWRLGALPMFIDEGTYIAWGLRALHAQGAGDLLASVPDGKQPLLPWLMAPVLAVVPDRLLAARLTVVAGGAAGALAAGALCWRLYGPLTGLLAGAVYVLAPLTFFYDRLAIYDGLIASCALVALATAVWWAERPTAWRTAALGAVLALTVLTKVSALLIAGAAPLAALALRPGAWRAGTLWRALAAYAVAGAAFGALLLHPDASMLYRGATDRSTFTPADLAGVPWRTWSASLGHLLVAITGYLPAPLWVAYGAGLLLPLVTRDRRDAVLAAWCLLLLGSTLLLDKVFYFRYFVPAAVAGLPLVARVLALLATRLAALFAPGRAGLAAALLLAAVAGPALRMQWQLWHDPYGAPVPGDRVGDREQYVLSRHAGWETDRLVDFLTERAGEGPLVVVVSPLTGHMRAWVEARLLYLPGVHVLLRDPRLSPGAQVAGLAPESEIRRLADGGGAVYFATSEWASAPQEQPYRENDGDDAVLVADFPRHDLPWRHRVYRLSFPRRLDHVRFAEPPLFGPQGQIALLGYDLQPPAEVSAPSRELTLYWQSRGRLERSYTVFVHGLAAGGAGLLVAQHDGVPGTGHRPTDRWRPGEVVRDPHPLVATPPHCAPYLVRVGWYQRETMERLPARSNGLPAGQGALQVLEVPGAGGPCDP